jgi:hypothetical protein
MRAIARFLFLVLIAVMVGANIPITTPASEPAMDLDIEEYGSGTYVVGEDGEGLTYTSSTATSTDVIGLMEACGVFDPSVDYNVRIDGFGTGLAPPTEGEYADLVGNIQFVDDVKLASGSKLPPAIDHSTEPYMPEPDSQGGQGSCGAWAVSYYANGYLQAKDNDFTEAHNGSNKSHLMSPAWVYNKLNYGYDSGSNWYRNHAVISSVGNADWETMPYSDRDLYGWGDEDAWRIAPKYRVKSTYDLVSTSKTMVIKAWLAEGYILPMAFDAYQYSHLSDDDIISSVEYSSNAANHANTIVGYNDSITADGEVGAFKIVNSWGRTWSTDGYWWMTYDALKELYWPVMRMYDYVDYEPKLIATLEQSTPASKDSKISVGTMSGNEPARQPLWWAGTRPYPSFMCLDITELVGEVGLSEFYLQYGSGATLGTVSSFELEWYPLTYDIGNPAMVVVSDDTPMTAPSTTYTTLAALHIDHSLPANGTWHRGLVTIKGTADASVSSRVLTEDFEGRWTEEWTTEDWNTQGGLDTWGTSMFRKDGGTKSAYCAGSDGDIVLFEDFDEGGFLPADWSSKSLAIYQYPWAVKNTGYQGSGGTDYLVATRSDRGGGFNNTELLYMNSPTNASSFEDLSLRFRVEYKAGDGDEYLKVLYADEATHPNWTVLDTYTTDTLGYKSYDLSSLDGENKIYLAFEYHGTDDKYATIDDVLLSGNKTAHDPLMKARMYISPGDMTRYDSVNLTYNYWIDSEQGVDVLSPMFRTSATAQWQFLANHSGAGKAWTEATVEVPVNASHVGFRFFSDSVNESEGAYLDDLTLTGYHNISSVDVSVDGGAWDPGVAAPDWSYEWNTTAYDDGDHLLAARVNYSGAYDQVAFFLRTDNSPPDVSMVWNETVSTGDNTSVHISASDLMAVSTVRMLYNYNADPEVEVTVTDTDNATWNMPVSIPDDAVDMFYRFILNDTLGNEVETDKVHVLVIDNDDPSLGADATPAVATTGDPFTFDVRGLDNVMVENVTLEYWYGIDEGSAISFLAESARLQRTVVISNVLDTIGYRYSVTDTSGNSFTSLVQRVTIVDNDDPQFGPDGTPAQTSTGGNVTLSINATDNIQLVGIWVEYNFGEDTPVNVSLVEDPSGNWTLTLDVAWDSIDPLHYVFKSVDSSGNWNATHPMTVIVVDDHLPWFGADSTPVDVTTGDPLSFAVDLYDNIGIGRAWVEYWYGNESHHDTELTSGDGLTWDGDQVARHTYLSIWYVIHIEDTRGNHNATSVRRVLVLDDDDPYLLEDGSPVQTTTGVEYRFSLDVEDNLDVESVIVTYWYEGGDTTNGQLLTTNADGNGNGTYQLLGQVPEDSTASLHYFITVHDSSGNTNTTEERTVTVLDVTNPMALAGADAAIDQHEEVTFSSAGSSDNVGIVQWRWTFSEASVAKVLEGPEQTYTFNEAGIYKVTLTVKDPSGNTATDTLDLTVRDVTKPVPHAGTDRRVDQNTTVLLDASGSTDNVAVTGWTWTLDYDGSGRELSGQDVQFPFRTPGVYEVTLTVFDRAGNSDLTTINITVTDTIDPVPRTPKDMDGVLDEDLTFDGSLSSDNVGIVNFTWIVVKPSGGVIELYGSEVAYTPREPGDHEVSLAVTDADGNSVTSDPFTIHVANMQLWLTLIIIVVASVVATTAVALYTRRKTRKMDEQRTGRK